ncbi:hypothetical protein F4T81_03675 [Acinetobacter nosocomialis]|uniref:hypothetical protein n=1 Tax=Acinetobacter nosocomialis TaxID=106654 RepID=UPI0012987823|nr:hypothetical protein [Acinetobacter nosocomialis]MRA09712.1 hypothetical protein [Acinetobacter nosocomialis]
MSFNKEDLNKLVLLKESAEIINDIRTYIYRDAKSQKNLNLGLNLAEYQVANAFRFIVEIIIIFEDILSSPELILEESGLYIKDLNNELYKALDLKENTNELKFKLMLSAILIFVRKIAFENFKSKEIIDKKGYSIEVVKIFDILSGYIDNSSSLESDFYKKIILNEENLINLNKRFDDFEILTTNAVDNHISPLKDKFTSDFNKLSEDFKNEVDAIRTEFINAHKVKVDQLSKHISETDTDFKATYEDYDTLKKMVNAKGEQEVTNYYKNKANWERFTYWFMTTLTFIIIGGAICLATLSLNDYKTKTSINIDEWSQKLKNQPIEKIEKIYELQQKNALIYLILRLVISIFLFSSIIYTSRIAYRAYIHMRHSENMRLKLATLRPFINHLDSNDKKQIHKDLIPDYFGKDAGLVDTANEKFKDLPANVSAVAMKAIEQISGSGSNSSTEKNGKKSEGGTE